MNVDRDAADNQVDLALRRLAELIAQSPHNLVSRTDRNDVWGNHIQECRAYVDALALQAGQRWIDIGTGGGLPGLVLAASRPDTQWTLVDGTAKKVRAVQEFAGELGLDNVTAIQAQAEELAHDQGFRGQFDGAISRAVAPMPILAELLAAFVRPTGNLVAVKGSRWKEEVQEAAGAFQELGLEFHEAIHIPSAQRPTWLVMMRPRGTVPQHYPRRAGLPRSKPLGGT